MKLHFNRDQARSVEQYILPLMMQTIEMRIRQAKKESDECMIALLTKSIMKSVKKKIDRKLLTVQNKFAIDLQTHEQIIFNMMLMNHPIDAKEIWLLNLRNHITSLLHNSIFEPKNMYAE